MASGRPSSVICAPYRVSAQIPIREVDIKPIDVWTYLPLQQFAHFEQIGDLGGLVTQLLVRLCLRRGVGRVDLHHFDERAPAHQLGAQLASHFLVLSLHLRAPRRRVGRVRNGSGVARQELHLRLLQLELGVGQARDLRAAVRHFLAHARPGDRVSDECMLCVLCVLCV